MRAGRSLLRPLASRERACKKCQRIRLGEGASSQEELLRSDPLTQFEFADTPAHDMYLVDNAGDVVIEAEGDGADRIFASVSYTLGAGVHVERLSHRQQRREDRHRPDRQRAGEMIFVGNAVANVLDGGAGADSIVRPRRQRQLLRRQCRGRGDRDGR